MLREGLFSSTEFEKASADFVLLRLEPGPAERYFGITAAPMCAVADWYGRVVMPSINLRGNINSACNLLKNIIRDFDYNSAARPPFKLPKWAAELVKPSSDKEMGKLLDDIHPANGESRSKVSFEEFEKVYFSLDMEADIIGFTENLTKALEKRTPEWGKEYEGYKEEYEMLKKITYAANDGIKFTGIAAFGKFAPIREVTFLKERIEKKTENSRNPNVVLCRCLTAVGIIASRFPGIEDKLTVEALEKLLEMLPVLSKTLDTEGRNNSACLEASNAIKAIIMSTGAPEALEAFLHNLNGPAASDDFSKKYDTSYRTRAAGDLKSLTGLELGTDYKPWRDWYDKYKNDLVFNEQSKEFDVDKKDAESYRKKIRKAGEK